MSQEARDSLVEQHLPLVRRLARRFRNSGEPLEDLIQVGSVGLLKAFQKFEPQRGNSFAAFAIPVIIGEIKNYLRDHGWAVKIPRKLQRQKAIVEKFVESLTQTLGRPPDIQEIVDATGFSDEEVYDSFELGRNGRPLSLDAEYPKNGADEPSLLDYLGTLDPDLERLADKMDIAQGLSHLGQREKDVILMKFYGGLTQTTIAERLGISQMHVSRLQRAALKKLKQAMVKEATGSPGGPQPQRQEPALRHFPAEMKGPLYGILSRNGTRNGSTYRR